MGRALVGVVGTFRERDRRLSVVSMPGLIVSSKSATDLIRDHGGLGVVGGAGA